MSLTHTPDAEHGSPAPDFDLPGIDGRRRGLSQCCGPNGLLVMFISNHCPYVKAIRSRLVEDCREVQRAGIGCVAIMPNDTRRYPEDSFENMIAFAEEGRFPFPYLLDEDQQVARDYGAVCTPDFFGYDRDLKLRYRGRLDPYALNPPPAERERELLAAMVQVATTGKGPEEQFPSMGCSIKWR